MERLVQPRLVGIAGAVEGAFLEIAGDEVSIGREQGNTLTIDDRSVSRRHCSIHRLAAEGFGIRDSGSRNGTLVNGLPVTERVLRDGDEIGIGECRFLFVLSEAREPSDTFSTERDEQTSVLTRLRRDDNPLTQEPRKAAARGGVRGQLSLLVRIASGIQAARGTEEIARQLLERMFEITPAERGAVLLFEAARDEPVFAHTQHRDGAAEGTLHADGKLISEVRRDGIAILAGGSGDGGATRILAAPVTSLDNTIGIIYLQTDLRASFDEEHLQLATAIGGILGMPLENARRVEWLEAENRRLQEAVNVEHDMVGSGPRMGEIFQFVSKVAGSDSTVLIRGESGTGKELVARAIHRNSARAGQPFVAINCAAVTETLVESELFGHERGAFTGAMVQKKGKLEAADRGTLFLDEVGELPPAFQAKLLRVLQEREFERVGGTRPIQVDVRLIAATNRDLEAAIASGTFREDLYYRLNVVSVAMPPLRERREDIALLARHFVAKHGKRARRRLAGLSPEAIACLEAYDWPGNVRELENALERAAVLGSTELIVPGDLPEAVLETARAGSGLPGGYHRAVREEKKRAILAALEECGGRFTEAAELLGVHPNYLHRLVRNLNLRAEIKKTRN